MCDKCQQELDFFSNPFAMMDSMRNKMEAMHRNFVSDLVNSVNQFMHHLTACKELSVSVISSCKQFSDSDCSNISMKLHLSQINFVVKFSIFSDNPRKFFFQKAPCNKFNNF